MKEQDEIKKLEKELKFKEKEYKLLCAKFDELKAKNIDPNDPLLLKLKEAFVKNNQDIDKILKKLQKNSEE